MQNILEEAKEIRRLSGGYQSARVLITANNFRVFDFLEQEQTAGALARKIKADRRAVEILLDALTGMGLLKKNKGRYKNRPIASRLLVSGKKYYQGDIISHSAMLWDRWAGLDSVLKTGKPSLSPRNHTAFILGMHNLAVLKAGDIIKGIGFKGVQRALDLGGGPGTYVIEMAKKGIDVTLFDLPETVKIAKKVAKQSGLNSKKIKFIGGDFLNDDIGSGYDLVFISQIVHMFPEKVNIGLIKKCMKSLSENGRIIIHDFFINEDRTQPVHSALFAINMLVNTSSGRTYSPGEISQWFRKAGLKEIRKKIVADGVLVSAVK
jgi:2-polyprenyl-3-methyl-5-hydroxy-6-metoxy-1,4-benzoquinol methylase/DNA-binding MarR family transcriptional regulator